jgi:hypothetical protein
LFVTPQEARERLRQQSFQSVAEGRSRIKRNASESIADAQARIAAEDAAALAEVHKVRQRMGPFGSLTNSPPMCACANYTTCILAQASPWAWLGGMHNGFDNPFAPLPTK